MHKNGVPVLYVHIAAMSTTAKEKRNIHDAVRDAKKRYRPPPIPFFTVAKYL
jgi:hypothetical protein